jgi:hypothetical protein
LGDVASGWQAQAAEFRFDLSVGRFGGLPSSGVSYLAEQEIDFSAGQNGKPGTNKTTHTSQWQHLAAHRFYQKIRSVGSKSPLGMTNQSMPLPQQLPL